MESFLGDRVELRPGDCREVIRAIPDNSLDSVVCDPPYALVSIVKRFGGKGAAPVKDGDVYARSSAGFMGKQWDTGETAFAVEFWAEVFRALKPGGHIVAFSGTRTYHRMTCAIEDAGFEIRDQLAWIYGSGFPKSHDVSKGIDKAAGAVRGKVRHKPRADTSGTMAGASDTRPWIEESREKGFHEVAGPDAVTDDAKTWQGWGTALKPAWEPICLARKPLIGTVAANVLAYQTGALNIDGCRVETEEVVEADRQGNSMGYHGGGQGSIRHNGDGTNNPLGRWPANIVHDGSDEVLSGFPETGPSAINSKPQEAYRPNGKNEVYGSGMGGGFHPGFNDASGSAARFFYTAKADGDDRLGSKHPTVKPVDLMQWLCRLVTPPGGLILDPFAGTGTTGEAAYLEGFRAILIEREEEYQADIRKRMGLVISSSAARKEAARANKPQPGMGIFEGLE